MVPNSCATHALVSILLNCPDLNLGSNLSRLRDHVKGMDSENKGYAIGNSPELAHAHNSHAVPRARRRMERNNVPSGSTRYSGEAFHFVSYVPINGHLYELDGLKRYPIDHGLLPEGTDWTETFRQLITERLGIATGDIRFALMAVVPDRRKSVLTRLQMLKTNRTIVVEALKHLVKATDEGKEEEISFVGDDKTSEEYLKLEKQVDQMLLQKPPPVKPIKKISSRTSSLDSGGAPPGSPFQNNPLLTAHDYAKSPLMEVIEESPSRSATPPKEEVDKEDVKSFDPKIAELSQPLRFAPKDLLALLRNIEQDMHSCEVTLKEENEKHRKHKIDDCRRIHDYDEFITTFVSMLAEQGNESRRLKANHLIEISEISSREFVEHGYRVSVHILLFRSSR